MYDVFWSLKVVLVIANSVDPDEMQHDAAFLMLHFICVFTVCRSTHLAVSSIHRGSYMSAHALLNLLNEWGEK